MQQAELYEHPSRCPVVTGEGSDRVLARRCVSSLNDLVELELKFCSGEFVPGSICERHIEDLFLRVREMCLCVNLVRCVGGLERIARGVEELSVCTRPYYQ
jgi:hypothetical protein